MMNDLQNTAQEKSVLRWGGLAGIVGGILLVAVFVIVGVFVGLDDPAEPERLVERFPDVRAAMFVAEVLYLGGLALWAIHFLALYRALRDEPRARAVRERAGHHGSRRARGRSSSAGREDPDLRPLPRSWGDP